jgi:lysophospholipase L1-like esterase
MRLLRELFILGKQSFYMWRTIGINVLVFLGILLLIEFSGQLIALVKNRQFLFANFDYDLRHTLFKRHPYLSVSMNSNVKVDSGSDFEYLSVTTTELGTRYTGANLNDTSAFRIVCIGGSTTFCTGVSDEDSWPAILQQRLGDKFAVINFGVPAYKTVEAIIQLALFVTELKPQLVIFYGGGNDMYNYHMENTYPDYYHHGEHLMPMALLGAPKYESCFDKLQRQSGFFYLLNNVREIFQEAESPTRHVYPDSVVDQMYERNLKTILAITSTWECRELVIGQVLNPFIEFQETPWSIKLQRDSILPYMERMNQIARNVCNTDSTCDYLDFVNGLTWKPEHFWDEMHFTQEGNKFFADALSVYFNSGNHDE